MFPSHNILKPKEGYLDGKQDKFKQLYIKSDVLLDVSLDVKLVVLFDVNEGSSRQMNLQSQSTIQSK